MSKTVIMGPRVSICHILLYFYNNLYRAENNTKKNYCSEKPSFLPPTSFKLDLDPFPPEERYEVKVREGVGAVLLCEPPYHYPGNSAQSA